MQDDPKSSEPPPSKAARAGETWVGRIIDGRYRILESLGEGGMGAVFMAEHLQLHKRVALKIIHAHLAGHHEIAERFAREAMTSAHIDHPNVASALDYGRLPQGGAYLVMQLVRGPSLKAYLSQRGALSAAETCRIAVQIADAVAAAHAAGVVHRDLKPDNVVLLSNEAGPPTIKVLDFGIAHVKPHDETTLRNSKALTRVGSVIGTPGYMPPEQAMGQAVDERADLYALGVILWELLMGKRPFGGGTFSEIVTQQLQGPAPGLSLSSDHAIPEPLRALVHALLERAPADRPASATEVGDRLRAIAAQLNGSSQSMPSMRVREGVGSAARTAASTFMALSPKWRWGTAALALALVIAILGGGGDGPAAEAPVLVEDAFRRVEGPGHPSSRPKPTRVQRARVTAPPEVEDH